MDDKATKTIYRLTEATRQGEIMWTPQAVPGLQNQAARLSEQYVVHYRGEKLRLSIYSGFVEGIRLQLLDNNEAAIWEFPPHRALQDLLNTVRSKTGVAERLERLFS